MEWDRKGNAQWTIYCPEDLARSMRNGEKPWGCIDVIYGNKEGNAGEGWGILGKVGEGWEMRSMFCMMF